MTFPDFLDLNEFVYNPEISPKLVAPKTSYANMAKK